VAGARRAVLLLTDGRDENSALNLEDGLAVAQKGGIPVYTVALGRADERALRRIARLTGGAHVSRGERPAHVLARHLRALPPPRAAEAAPEQASPSAADAPPPATTPAATAAPAPSPRGSGLLGLVLGVLAALSGVGILAFLLWRRGGSPAAHLCPTCGRALTGPLADCASCGLDAGAARRPPAEPEPAAGRFVPDLSPTVLERLNMTEEYLDKTVTLRERPVLVVAVGSNTGQVYDLSYENAISIGRAKANDIILGDVAVSSQHCRVRPDAEGFEVLDLKSTNGTWVNERRVTRHRLSEGDKLRVGDTTLEYRHQQRYN
jgi:hypothetical protein